MKAIETKYKGYRFRSRLEARWAVYFDAIKIKWEYEKEGYKLDSGDRYLPDFWLSQVNMWGEVKPGRFSEAEINKVKELVKGASFPFILLEGTPDERSYAVVYLNDKKEVVVGEPNGNDCVISMYHNYPINEQRFYSCSGGGLSEYDFGEGGNFSDVRFAVKKARSARFEFGENGT
ncbi:MAG: hypothetical protein P9X22_05765 [Candidatus Zapsychrus exili]|nr:hypothetical protein [Candidatus Zapsychrus exili]